MKHPGKKEDSLLSPAESSRFNRIYIKTEDEQMNILIASRQVKIDVQERGCRRERKIPDGRGRVNGSPLVGATLPCRVPLSTSTTPPKWPF